MPSGSKILRLHHSGSVWMCPYFGGSIFFPSVFAGRFGLGVCGYGTDYSSPDEVKECWSNKKPPSRKLGGFFVAGVESTVNGEVFGEFCHFGANSRQIGFITRVVQHVGN